MGGHRDRGKVVISSFEIYKGYNSLRQGICTALLFNLAASAADTVTQLIYGLPFYTGSIDVAFAGGQFGVIHTHSFSVGLDN